MSALIVIEIIFGIFDRYNEWLQRYFVDIKICRRQVYSSIWLHVSHLPLHRNLGLGLPTPISFSSHWSFCHQALLSHKDFQSLSITFLNTVDLKKIVFNMSNTTLYWFCVILIGLPYYLPWVITIQFEWYVSSTCQSFSFWLKFIFI